MNVHHLHYTKGCEPWEYPDNALVTLCPRCHNWVHNYGIELEVRPSLISSSWICGIKNDEDAVIKSGTVLTNEDGELIHLVAGRPFFELLPLCEANGLTSAHPSEYPVSKMVECYMSFRRKTKELFFNEYVISMSEPFDMNTRYATEEEKKELLDAIKAFMK